MSGFINLAGGIGVEHKIEPLILCRDHEEFRALEKEFNDEKIACQERMKFAHKSLFTAVGAHLNRLQEIRNKTDICLVQKGFFKENEIKQKLVIFENGVLYHCNHCVRPSEKEFRLEYFINATLTKRGTNWEEN